MSEYYLVHHGIKGQKWGVRRYQNEDGSLTEAGKKRYGNMSGEKLYRTLKKSIRTQRGQINGTSNRFMVNTGIGKMSNSLIEERLRKEKEWEEREDVKAWDKKFDQLDAQFDKNAQKYGYEKALDIYNENWEKLMKEQPPRDFNTLMGAVVYGKNSKEYTNNYLTGGGKDLSIAYLRDLGFNEDDSKAFVDKMIGANRTLGLI